MPKNMIEIWAPVITATSSTDNSHGLECPVNLHDFAKPYNTRSMVEASSEKLRAYTVPMSELTGNLKQTLSNFQQVMDDLPKPASGYCIDEIELHLGVNGNGGIALIGKLTVGMEAAIKVKIKRLP